MTERTKFAKLYETKEFGQILVRIARSVDGAPTVIITFQTDWGIDLEVKAAYSDDDGGWIKAETYFAMLDEARAKEQAARVIELVG